MGTCYKCNNECVPKEEKTELFGLPCDICRRIICKNCSGVRSSEVRVLIMKERCLRHFCPDCLECFSMMPGLKRRISELEAEIDAIKLGKPTNETPGNLVQADEPVSTKNLADAIGDQLKYQTELISEKLNGTINSIIQANKELVQFMTASTVLVHKDNVQVPVFQCIRFAR